jgi:RNase_H superfamily
MTKTRHQNKHLNSSEVAILKAWAWEEAHRDKDGPAHRLFREHGIDFGQPLAILHAADLELPNEEALGDRIVPGEWPWGEHPPVRLNRHCIMCEFRADCQRLAEEADDLSLLRGLSEKEMEKQLSRGVTTVTQFAYTYRPGRRGKRRSGKARKHDHALQAVAIGDKKVYVLDSPMVPHSRVALYLDVEGIPDRGFDYLVGLVAVEDDRTTTHFFWADDRSQEKVIWDACSQVINSFEDYTLYHYGQYPCIPAHHP